MLNMQANNFYLFLYEKYNSVYMFITWKLSEI